MANSCKFNSNFIFYMMLPYLGQTTTTATACMYPIYPINFTVDTLVSIVEVRKIGEVVGDIALEGISELKDIVWGVFEEGIELVLVVNLNLAFSLVLPKSCSTHLSTMD